MAKCFNCFIFFFTSLIWSHLLKGGKIWPDWKRAKYSKRATSQPIAHLLHSGRSKDFHHVSVCVWLFGVFFFFTNKESPSAAPLITFALSPLPLSAEPLPLTDLCRRAARIALGRERLQEIESLPLPESLKNYLQYQWLTPAEPTGTAEQQVGKRQEGGRERRKCLKEIEQAEEAAGPELASCRWIHWHARKAASGAAPGFIFGLEVSYWHGGLQGTIATYGSESRLCRESTLVPPLEAFWMSQPVLM